MKEDYKENLKPKKLKIRVINYNFTLLLDLLQVDFNLLVQTL